MTGLIYTFTNKENGKEYVGQTIQPIEVRDYAHYYEAFNQNRGGKFNNALRKYGKGGFVRSIVHEITADTAEELIDKLNELEDMEILARNTITNGYNTLRGGRNVVKTCGNSISKSKMNSIYKNSSIIEQYDKNGNLIATIRKSKEHIHAQLKAKEDKVNTLLELVEQDPEIKKRLDEVMLSKSK